MADNVEAINTCPHCGYDMAADYDYVNKVKVMVCTKPTCLFRVYPDYPRRNGDEEVCYLCGKIFIIQPDSAGVLCAKCRGNVLKQKDNQPHREKRARKRRGLPGRMQEAV